jgi:TolB-like protein/Flp pilus assembly protein TadD/predicted Ser/Thr protein kinase
MSTPTPPRETISHYRLLEALGRGAMGEVWLAEDTQLPRKVAIKLLPRHLAEDPDAVDRLLREAQAAASVDHPGVVTVYDAGVADGRPYLVMQRVEGETLEERLARGPLPIDDAIVMTQQLADALAEVHALGIVHRDLKPANVVLTPRGAKILDFGVASVKGSPRLTSTGTAIGTPLAMSPEQIKGQPPDNRSDLWSLGVMLYEALTGKSPFAGASFEAVMHAILNEQPKPPGTLRDGIGPDLDFIVMKLLRKDPAHRYARAEELISDLASCEACRIEPGGASAAPPATPRLAVLTFEVMSPEADDAFLAAGLAEDLIVDLTRLGGLIVASRADVLPYRDRVVPPRTLARELGVDYVLTGSVRRAGNRARISTQLVRAADGHALWAERFDRTLEDLFEVQAEVSKRIVEALQVALKPGEREMLDRAPTKSQEAYGFYVRALDLMEAGIEDNRRAEELLKRATELDPDFALAHAALGQCYALRGMRWWGGTDSADLAMASVERALAIDPDLFEAKIGVAMVHRLRGDTERLLATLEEAVKTDPEHALALEWMGWSYLGLGRPQQALGILERLVARHPGRFTARYFLSACYQMLGRTEDAKRLARRALEGEIEFVRQHPDDPLARVFLGSSLVRDGQIEAGIAQVERAISMSPNDGRIRYNAACALALAGKAERALAELGEGFRSAPTYITDWPKRDPDLASLREHPEFVRMFGRLPD